MQSLFTLFLAALALLASPSARAVSLVNEIGVPSDRRQALVNLVKTNEKRAQEHFAREQWGLEIITAGSTLNKVESIFGHTLIRLLDNDEDPLNDTVIGFEMLPVDEASILEKAFKGGYETVPMVKDLVTYLSQYSLRQSRSTIRLILPTTPAQMAAIKTNFLQMLAVTDLSGDYLFLSNNCATVLLKLLGSSGYPTPWTLLDVPTLLESRLRSSLILDTPAIPLPSLSEILWDLACRYLQTEKGVGSCTVYWLKETAKEFSLDHDVVKRLLADEAFWDFIEKNTDDFQKAVLFHLWPDDYMSSLAPGAKAGDAYIRLIQMRQRHAAVLQEWPLKRMVPSFPRELYDLCAKDDVACRAARLEAARKTWGQDVLLKTTEGLRERYNYERHRAGQLTTKGRQVMAGWLTSPIVQSTIRFSVDLRSGGTVRRQETPND